MTTIINMFGGPGISKSTSSSQLFYLMKNAGMNVELVTEFAKELTWSRSQSLSCQPYVFGNQLIRIEILRDQVDYVITDSPILLSCIYNPTPELSALAIQTHHTFSNMNILLNRKKEYVPIGRSQTLAESIEIDNQIQTLLNTQKIDHIQCDGDSQGIDRLFNLFIKPRATP